MQSTAVAASGGTPNQEDILANRFPGELIRDIWETMPLQDLIAYGNTCRLNWLRVQDVICQLTDNEIHGFCTDPVGFHAMLWTNKSMVSGSVALAALVLSKLQSWQPYDMDMYTSSRRLNRVLKYLEKVDGYKIVLRTVARPNNYLDMGGDQGGHEGGEHLGFVHGCYRFGPEVNIQPGFQILQKPRFQRDYRSGAYFDVPRADACRPVIVEF